MSVPLGQCPARHSPPAKGARARPRPPAIEPNAENAQETRGGQAARKRRIQGICRTPWSFFIPTSQRAHSLAGVLHRVLSCFHAQAGRHQEAVDAYTESLALEGVSAEFQAKLFCNRAAALSSLKQWKQVVCWGCFECVLFDSLSILSRPFIILEYLSYFDRLLQVDDCTSAIKLKEDYGKAYSRRAQAYSELEEFAEAVRDLEKLKELEPENEGLRLGRLRVSCCGTLVAHPRLFCFFFLLATDVRPKLRQAKLDLKKSLRKDYYKCVFRFPTIRSSYAF